MAQLVVRAAQTNYETDVAGGTRDVGFNDRDVAPFMDAVENQDTIFLNSLKKGKPGNQRKERTGIHGVTPRGSEVAASINTSTDTITVVTNHGVRFQQGHVLRVTKTTTGESERMWVTEDPGASTLKVKRARGGTTALSFTNGDKIKIVGIAMPQLTDFPLAPVSRGRTWHNFYQEFSKHVMMSSQARKTPNMEYPTGDWLDRDMLQLAKDIKMDLEQALLSGRRQEGSPNPADLDPSMLGGFEQFAELSGNVFNVGGSSTKLSLEPLEDALIRMDEQIGSNAGSKLLMSIRTKQIFNRLAYPSRYQMGMSGGKAETRWNTVQLEVGDYEFSHVKGVPDGKIFIYNPSWPEYAPFDGLDWKEKEVPTKGNYVWKGISGTFTYRPGKVPGYGVIHNFDINLANYPQWGKPAA
ncbi:MAG TPA: hypothetical protein VNZ58_02240 [Thermomicrobiales bacterium]|nr:hypothetical protein [Thermomicrobiales bacterium]